MPKSQTEKYRLQIQMSLSEETGKLLEKVAEEREMTLTALVKELVFLGLQSLKYQPAEGVSTLKAIDPSHEGRYGT